MARDLGEFGKALLVSLWADRHLPLHTEKLNPHHRHEARNLGIAADFHHRVIESPIGFELKFVRLFRLKKIAQRIQRRCETPTKHIIALRDSFGCLLGDKSRQLGQYLDKINGLFPAEQTYISSAIARV